MKPIAAAVAGALISGVAMYTVGAKTADVDAFADNPALVQTLDGQYVALSDARPVAVVPNARPIATNFTPVSAQRVSSAPARRVSTRPAPTRTVYRTSQPVQERVIAEEEKPERSWGKTALLIGGSAGAGAGVGAIVGGKKGALAGAAIGGGAASIYEATRRR
jgi:hypothetical protein